MRGKIAVSRSGGIGPCVSRIAIGLDERDRQIDHIVVPTIAIEPVVPLRYKRSLERLKRYRDVAVTQILALDGVIPQRARLSWKRKRARFNESPEKL